MSTFKQLLTEAGITNLRNIHTQEIPSDDETQARDLNFEYINLPQLNSIKEILEGVLTGEKDPWTYFETLQSPSKHFSLQISKQNPNIIIASSSSPLSVFNGEHFLLHDDQIAIFEVDNSNVEIITTQTHALAIGSEHFQIKTKEIELSPIPSFQENAPAWLLPSLQGQDQLLKKAIAFGDVSRFEEIKIDLSTLSKDNFLAQLQNPKQHFSWENIHPLQQKLLKQYFNSWINDLTTQIKNLLAESDEIEEKLSQWLQERDQLQSLLCVVQHYSNPTTLIEKIETLDRSFPHAKTSHILPQNHRLAEAYSRDPSCWWGKSSKMRRLYDQLSNA